MMKAHLKKREEKPDVQQKYFTQMTGAAELHQRGIQGLGVSTIVIDTYFNVSHPFFQEPLNGSESIDAFTGKPLPARPTTEKSPHGNLVSRTYLEMAPRSQLYLLEVNYWQRNDGLKIHYLDAMAMALYRAAELPADLVSISIDLERWIAWEPQRLKYIDHAMRAVIRSGKSVFYAAGNLSKEMGCDDSSKVFLNLISNWNNFGSSEENSSHFGIFTLVGSFGYNQTYSNEYICHFSNRVTLTPSPYFLFAPGDNIPCDLLNSEIVNKITCSGTSYSTPIVAGAVALLKEAFPNYTNKQIHELLILGQRNYLIRNGKIDTTGVPLNNGAIQVDLSYYLGLLSQPESLAEINN